MALELKNEDSAPWTVQDADLLPGGDATVAYTIRRLTLDKHREITRKHTKHATHKRPEQIDQSALQDALFDYVLIGWTNVVAKGEPVPCDWNGKRLIDVARRIALLDAAGMNEIAAAEDARADSFRPAVQLR